VFTLAHLSDLHAAPISTPRFASLSLKQALGWLKWSWQRSRQHRSEVLEALVADLCAERPDHVAITGDLTNLSLAEEFHAALQWLHHLGGPGRVSLVPGNHDAYIRTQRTASWEYWAEYMESDPKDSTVAEESRLGRHDLAACFPNVRIRGPLALVGVSSALPVGLLRANGKVGTPQREKLEHMLRELARANLCRVVLVHHPPTDIGLSARRRLRDAGALRAVLEKVGAELVLHGHTHKTVFSRIAGPVGPIPVVGVRSASDIGHRPGRGAQYHLYRIERRNDEPSSPGFRITMSTRSYDAERGCFRPDGEQGLSKGENAE
jgi:3',5'-cyclic AMP phosphodiesterase CpdA